MSNSISQMKKSEVGEVRPSQTLTTYGVASLVDLPNISVIVMGLDDWPASQSLEIPEERLLLSAQSILGPQVSRLLTPPRGPESMGAQTNWFDESRQIGIPVAAFPRWMVCSTARTSSAVMADGALTVCPTPPTQALAAAGVPSFTTPVGAGSVSPMNLALITASTSATAAALSRASRRHRAGAASRRGTPPGPSTRRWSDHA